MHIIRRIRHAALGVALAVGALAVTSGPALAADSDTVFTSTNSAAGNAVLAFDRADGSLTLAGSFATGGNGTGAGLGSQGALGLGDGGRFLYVVNAGSNSVSAFAVRDGEPDLLGTTPSGGERPISLTVKGDLLYVVNGASRTIVGFTGAREGELVPLAASTRALAGSGPAQIGFSHDGRVLVVTEKATNTIDTFAVGEDGRPSPAQTNPSNGTTPFGFAFDQHGRLIVSEAFGGASGASAVSSYAIFRGGLDTISASVPDGQSAACWIAVTNNDRFVYATNTGSGSISSYALDQFGSVSLLRSVAAATGPGSGPTDLAVDDSSRGLFALLPGSGAVAAYHVGPDGSLTATSQAGGVPASAVGLVTG
jgi:6-phosphogluconolactonase (cycloisomerase 2 family)